MSILLRIIACVAMTASFAWAEPAPAVTEHQTRTIVGWTVKINERLQQQDKAALDTALKLLEQQLQEIVRVVPPAPVTELQKVTLWISPEYPGIGPRAEYHPGADWLRANGRDPAMVKGIEFTNVRIFAEESRRMPNFALHELAHAYHDRVLGNDHAEIRAALERAKADGKYDRVERRDAKGNVKLDRAYALTNAQEYFAETTEAFFSINDFYPFTRRELMRNDPEVIDVLKQVWNAKTVDQVTAPPPSMSLPPFYEKYLDADGYPIVASAKVNDYALQEAAYLINLMLAKRPDVRAAMIRSGSRMCIIAHNEFTTDLPEWAHMKPRDFWDARARGMGGSQRDPLCSCGEENLLAYSGDPYKAENILIHEFAHNIHLRGMVNVDPSFDTRVKAAYDAAMKSGLWKGKYGSVNHHEYFAEGVQSWFDDNRENDHDHNHVNTRAELLEYDPGLAALCREVFGDTELKYTKPTTRLRDHLAGYDPSVAPAFSWPERVRKAQEAIRKQAQERSRAVESTSPAPPKSSDK